MFFEIGAQGAIGQDWAKPLTTIDQTPAKTSKYFLAIQWWLRQKCSIKPRSGPAGGVTLNQRVRGSSPRWRTIFMPF